MESTCFHFLSPVKKVNPERGFWEEGWMKCFPSDSNLSPVLSQAASEVRRPTGMREEFSSEGVPIQS